MEKNNEWYQKVLTTRDTKLWKELVDNIPSKDIYFTPEYNMLFEKGLSYEAELFFYGNDNNYIIHPFFKKKINDLPFYDGIDILYDISSPWFYGGPLVFITNEIIKEELLSNFLMKFHDFCTKNNIITEFVRLHPLIQNHLLLKDHIPLEKRWEIVYVDLTQDEEIIWNNLKKENRKAIRLAKKNNIEILVTRKEEDIKEFYMIYLEEMKRKHAEEFYFFSEDFFYNMFKLLKDHVQLFIAKYNGEVIAGSILLGMGDFAHDYFRGSKPEFLRLCPNNLLVYTKILWAKENNYKFFSLQGGQSKNDGILRFKLTFSESTLDFYTYSKIHDYKKYKLLCEERDKFDMLRGKEIIKSDYFPEYRKIK
ncbi:MAG TPA: GNAT family N-acetyltransferase [Candidatus Limnocylindrales bacterium]|nr:GNAT family N-acetyltransferase [Candidatus Limnocylindrales bacterium]